MKAPERIWAVPSLGGDWTDFAGMWWPEDTGIEPQAEYVRADLAQAPAPVRVKALQWIEIEDDDCDFEAFASGLRYWIVSVTDHQHTVKCNTYEIGDCLTVEKAKAAAQADYEARILAALEAPDAGVVAELVEATLDAAHAYLVEQYGSSPLAHPVDRSRVLAKLETRA